MTPSTLFEFWSANPPTSPSDFAPAPARPSPFYITSSRTTEPLIPEHITISTIHDMLVEVLGRMSALREVQASTNYALDELRRSIPAPQERVEIDERIRRVEVLVETLVRDQVHSPGETSQGMDVPESSGVNQGASSP